MIGIESAVRPFLGLVDELLRQQSTLLDVNSRPLFVECRERLCQIVGSLSKDKYDRLIHTSLAKGGLAYIKEL